MRVTARDLVTPRRRQPLPRRERDVKKAILAYLRTVPGVVAWPNNVGAVKEGARFVRFGVPGLPDIVGWRTVDGMHARFLAIECKSDAGRLRPAQRVFRQMALRDRVLYIEARSVDDVLAALR